MTDPADIHYAREPALAVAEFCQVLNLQVLILQVLVESGLGTSN